MTSATSEGVYIFTATGQKNMQWWPPYNKERGKYPKKHFEVINFILGHFVNFLEEIYQEKILDVSSPLRKRKCVISKIWNLSGVLGTKFLSASGETTIKVLRFQKVLKFQVLSRMMTSH